MQHSQRSPFQTVGIIGKYGDNDVSETIALILQVIDGLLINALIDEETTHGIWIGKTHHQTVDREILARQSDLIITVGGDGSFLYAGRSALTYNKPIVGVNMGRLGFLTDISPDEVSCLLQAILLGQYLHEKRLVLTADIVRDKQIIASNIAINDVVIHKNSIARLIELEVYLDNQFLSAYHADGLIVASPTGSTAYALSSGGAILQGSLEALTLVPICPHTLTQRPIVLNGQTQLRIVVSQNNRTDLQVSIDGQKEVPLYPSDTVLVTKHAKKLNMYHPENYDQLSRLRQKLGWGNEPLLMWNAL